MKNNLKKLFYFFIFLSIISCNGQDLSCENLKNKIKNKDINKFIKNTKDEYSYTILGFAIKCGNLEIIKSLVVRGANLDLSKSDDIYEYDALFVAIEEGNYKITQYLLEKGSNPNKIYDENGLTPLSLSVITQNFNITKLLLENKANIKGAKGLGGEYTIIPLREAINKGNKDIIKLLIDSGADISVLNEKELSIVKQYVNNKVFSNKEANKLIQLQGNYLLITQGDPIGDDNPSDVYYYFSFQNNKAILSIGSDNLNEIYCEGEYSITNQSNNIYKLKYIDEKICSSDDEINTLILKKENQDYYIKGDRFLNKEWLKLKKQ